MYSGTASRIWREVKALGAELAALGELAGTRSSARDLLTGETVDGTLRLEPAGVAIVRSALSS